MDKLQEFKNVDDMAKDIGCQGEELQKTFEEYNQLAENAQTNPEFKDQFGKCKVISDT